MWLGPAVTRPIIHLPSPCSLRDSRPLRYSVPRPSATAPCATPFRSRLRGSHLTSCEFRFPAFVVIPCKRSRCIHLPLPAAAQFLQTRRAPTIRSAVVHRKNPKGSLPACASALGPHGDRLPRFPAA